MTTAIEDAIAALRGQLTEARDAHSGGERRAYLDSALIELDRLDEALARLTAEQAAVPPDREALAKRLEFRAGALAENNADFEELLHTAATALRSPADGYRAGAAAMQEIATAVARDMNGVATHVRDKIAAAIRALPLPSPPAEDTP